MASKSSKGGGRKRRRESGRDNCDASTQPRPATKTTNTATKTTTTTTTTTTSYSSSSLPRFLTPSDPNFEKHVAEHYKGFAHCSVDDLRPEGFHDRARDTLERLHDANYYQYDVVMAGGKHSSRTFVRRTLVGNPGITYKYLGLRLFAHAWSGPGASPLMQSIGEMNRDMIRMTRRFEDHQHCEYNLTLINYMEPTIHTRVGFKEEADYGMGKVSVSWHADSSLEPGSSIGVYHCLPTQRSSRWDWRIALRPSPDGGSTARPIVVDTKDGDAYFLLGSFNETHQHCVLAGSQSNRISSTHRVAITAEDTYEYILKRAKIARKRFRGQLEAIDGSSDSSDPAAEVDAKVVRYCQRVMTELESEWIAQYWLQGIQHDIMHTWWQKPMKTLEAYWRALELATARLVRRVCSREPSAKKIPRDVARVLVHEFKARQALREQWDDRRADKIYQRRISEEYRPVARPVFDASDPSNNNDDDALLPKDLSPVLMDLRLVLEESAAGLAVQTPPVAKSEATPKPDKAAPKARANDGEAKHSNTKKRRKKNKKKKGSMNTPTDAGKSSTKPF